MRAGARKSGCHVCQSLVAEKHDMLSYHCLQSKVGAAAAAAAKWVLYAALIKLRGKITIRMQVYVTPILSC